MSHLEEHEQKNVERLRSALNKPTPRTTDDNDVSFFDPWEDLMDGVVGGYDPDLDHLAIDVLKAVRDGTRKELFADPKRGLAAVLFAHMLASWLCDYGMNPHGSFPAPELEEMWDELIQKWEAYAKARWGAPEAET